MEVFDLLFCFYYICQMKEVLFKKSWEKFYILESNDSSPINAINKDEDFSVVFANPKYPLFTTKKNHEPSEELFSKHYANPLFEIGKISLLLVVEKDNDKLSLKFFNSHKFRKVGKNYFQFRKDVDYFTLNLKKGDVYNGYLKNYQNKKKYSSSIRKNYFVNDPFNQLKTKIKSSVDQFSPQTFDNGYHICAAFSTFVENIDGISGQNFHKENDRIFKFYLDKKNFKYPNNFPVFKNLLWGKEFRKILKKNSMKLVDSLMKYKGLSGKTIRKALHKCDNKEPNIEFYLTIKSIFGENKIHQEENLIEKIFDSSSPNYLNPKMLQDFIEVSTKEEQNKMFNIFKEIYIENEFDSYTFMDHIRFYLQLKRYGETELKWTSDSYDEEFRNIHLVWSEKLDFYQRGIYKRSYPDFFYEKLSTPIETKECYYYAVLLDETTNYNEESFVQSNCVRTYIGKASSIIVSLRKDSDTSKQRATLEYYISKEQDKIKIKRVQSKGTYNSSLDFSWSEALEKIDVLINEIVQDKRFETVSITKECLNGTNFFSKSLWNLDGHLVWEYKNIYDTVDGTYIW